MHQAIELRGSNARAHSIAQQQVTFTHDAACAAHQIKLIPIFKCYCH
jgi:hypothetical protein